MRVWVHQGNSESFTYDIIVSTTHFNPILDEKYSKIWACQNRSYIIFILGSHSVSKLTGYNKQGNTFARDFTNLTKLARL